MNYLKVLKRNSVAVLVVPAVLAIVLILKSPTSELQFGIISLLVIFYLGWAVIYHLMDKTLTLEVVVEYVLTAILSMIVLYGVLL